MHLKINYSLKKNWKKKLKLVFIEIALNFQLKAFVFLAGTRQPNGKQNILTKENDL